LISCNKPKVIEAIINIAQRPAKTTKMVFKHEVGFENGLGVGESILFNCEKSYKPGKC